MKKNSRGGKKNPLIFMAMSWVFVDTGGVIC